MGQESNRRPRCRSARRASCLCVSLGIFFLGAGAAAQTITGKIVVKQKLTKRSVTPAVSIYQRGTAVELGKDTPEDPLEFERSRVVIYLEGAGPTTTSIGQASGGPFTIEQRDRRFSPDLIVVPVGSKVSFPNRDPIFHNVFSLSKAKSFDLGSYDRGKTREVVFPKAGIVDIYCHLHPNMAATIVVTPSRWFARSDKSGQYRIEDVPPGKYTLVAWHKSAGFFKKSIVVESGHDSVTDFFIPLGDASDEVKP